jgi:glucose/arabinose dehydrogenase
MRTPVIIAIALVAALLATTTLSGQTPSDLSASVYATGFVEPVAFVQDPTNRSVQYVVQQRGQIRTVIDGVVQATPYLNLTGQIAAGGEQGLLGLALAPDYPTSGRVFVNFTNPAGHTVIARFRRSANPVVLDPASRFDLRWNGASGPAYIEQPYANHNGGDLAFGPDGYLYIAMGDGGAARDPEHRAQSPSSLLGKMLRVDVNVADNDPIGYRIPATNPFLSGPLAAARDEIWAFGYRNPWRFSFDPPASGGTGAMVVADVGQGDWEEVDYEPAGRGGRNYGWSVREGAHPAVARTPAFTPLVEPIHEYSHAVGQSITGGFVYRGLRLPPVYRGRYFFADFMTGRIWSIGLTISGTGEASSSGVVDHTAGLSNTGAPGLISAFGVDSTGELYLVSYTRGQVLRIGSTVPSPPSAPNAPTNLRILRSTAP